MLQASDALFGVMFAFDPVMKERRSDISARSRFEQQRLDLIRRLAHVCEHWPKRDLEALTIEMTRVKLRYARRTAVPAR